MLMTVAILAGGCTAASEDESDGAIQTDIAAAVETRAPTDVPEKSPAESNGPDTRVDAPTLEPSEPFSTTTIAISSDSEEIQLAVYVADTQSKRGRGLMGREQLSPGTGMIFTYPSDTNGQYWMRDTVIPLTIAFIAADGSMIELIDMEPCKTTDCPRYGPDEDYRYALEVPQGWFAVRGIDQDWKIDTNDL